MIIFVALIPQAVVTINQMFILIGISYQFPVHIASIVVVLFIIFIFAFGLIAVRFIGTITSNNEIVTKMNPGIFLVYKKLNDLEKKVVELEKQNRKDIDHR
jgi:hypothetical protein